MKIFFTETALSDYQQWEKQDAAKFKKIQSLLKNIRSTPFSGIGKPEPLQFNLQGFWSRRISKEHRLVYKIKDNTITVISCKFHYEK